MSDGDSNTQHGNGLDPAITGQLGKKLKEVYSDIINEPVPDRFLDLLNQLEESDGKSQAGK